MEKLKLKCPFRKVIYYQNVVRNGHPVPDSETEEFLPCIEGECMLYAYNGYEDVPQCLLGRNPRDIY